MKGRVFKFVLLLLFLSFSVSCARMIHQLEAPLPDRTEHKKAVILSPLEIPPELASPSVSQVD